MSKLFKLLFEMCANIPEIGKNYHYSTVERIGLTTLVVAILAAAAAVFALQFTSHLILSEKFAVPLLTCYGISSALLAIYICSLVVMKKNPPSEELPTDISAESGEVEIENNEPFLDSGVLNKLEEVKEPQNQILGKEQISLRKQAKEKLVEAKKYAAAVDWQQFALMNNTSFIKGSSLDTGHHTYRCLIAYINYLSLLQKEGPFFLDESNTQALEELYEALNVAKEIMSNFPKCRDEALNKKDLDSAQQKIQSIINGELAKKGYVYFPGGYCGRDDDSMPHAVACKFSLDLTKEWVTIAILNLGEGVQHHPELGASSTHMKTSYSYYPAIIPVALWKEIAPSFISHLLRFISDLPHKKTSYSSRDLYDLLGTLKSLSTQYIVDNGETLAGKPQYVGDCPEKSVRNIITDFLFAEKVKSQDSVNNVFLNLHFTSIVSAYYSYLNSPQDTHRELLVNACEEFANHLLRSKSFLKKEDYLEAAEIIDIILQEIKLKENQVLPSTSLRNVNVSTFFPSIDPPTPFSLKQIKNREQVEPTKIDLPPFKANSFRKDFEIFVESIKKSNKDSYNRRLINVYLLTLPVPKWGSLDEWDALPIEDIPSILGKFQPLIKRLSKYSESSEKMLAAFALSAVADKLVRRLDTKGELKTLSLPFPIDAIEQYLFFPVGSEEQKFQQIKEYFLKGKESSKGAILPYPKDLEKISPEMKILIKCAAMVAKLTEGECVDLEKLKECKSWQELPNDNNFYLSREQLLIQFFLKYKNFTTNDLLCKPKNYKPIKKGKECDDSSLLLDKWERKGIDKELLDELLLLLCNSKLQLGLVVQWIQGHFNELNKPFVQRVIEFALFSSGALKERAQEIPTVLQELRSLIEKGCIHYGDSYENYSATLFLINCGITLESYAAEFSKLPINEMQLENYNKRLNGLLSKVNFAGERKDEDDYFIQTLTSRHFLESVSCTLRSVEDFIELYTSLFKFGIINYGGCTTSFGVSSTIRSRYDTFYYHIFEQFQQFLDLQKEKKQEVLNAICNAIVDNLSQDKTSCLSWSCDPKTITFFSETYKLDFLQGAIFHAKSGHPLIYPFKYERENEHHKKFGIDPHTLWWMAWAKIGNEEKGVKISFDESIILVPNSGYGEPFLMKDKGALGSTTLTVFEKEDRKKLPILDSFPLIHYVKEETNQSSYILSCLKKEQKPFMRIDFSQKGVSFTRVDENGKALPYRLVNLEQLNPLHPLYAYTLHFAHSKAVHCFIHEATQEIEEIYFSTLNLAFKRKEKGLESTEFPGYFLTLLDLKALKNYSRDALVLRNAEGKIKVILPTPKVEKKKLGFSEETEKKKSESTLQKYFVYDLDSKEALFEHKHVSERLFIIYFLKVHGDYAAAQSELNKLHLHILDGKAHKIFALFLNLRDKTPLSLAFTQKLLLFFVDHLHLIQGYEKKEHTVEIRGYLKRACYWYENYLRAAGDDRINGIPIEWRLTEEEEFRILSIMEREEINLPKILKIRMELLLSESRSAEITFIPQEISLIPHALKHVIPPSKWQKISELGKYNEIPFGAKACEENTDKWIEYPNQVSDTYCQRFFVELFEQARGVPRECEVHPFDFTLLALLRNASKVSVSSELASLLFCVRQFSDYFNFPLASIRNENELKEAFNKVLSDVLFLYRSAGKELEEERLEKTEMFPYASKITLTLPEKSQIEPLSLSVNPLNITSKPFQSCCKALFTASTDASGFGEEKLFEPSLFENQPLEKEIVEKYESALNALSRQENISYTLNEENIGQVKQDLISRKQDYLERIAKAEKGILESVNDPFNTFNGEITLEEEKEFRLRLNAHQTYSINPEMIMQEVILKDSTAFFDEHRPMLKKEHLEAIVGVVNHYYHLLVLSSMCDEALDLLDKVQKDVGSATHKQDLLNVLNYEFLYSPEKYPEIAYMKVKTGKLPRKEQALVYQWICEGFQVSENRLFQLSAGGGKTSYLIPLMILRSKRHQLVPFVLTTQSMYGIEKENLKITLALLGLELDTLEIGMNTKLTVENLKIIYQQFVAVRQSGKAVIITPQTYYSLRLHYFTSVTNETDETSLLLQNILDFINKRGLLLGDECHRNFDPMTQAIFGLGQFVNLEHPEEHLLKALVKPLLGMETVICENGKKLSEIAQSKENGKGEPTKGEVLFIQTELAQHILKTFFVNIPATDHKALAEFWIDKKASEPSCLGELKTEERYLILLGRYFFTSLLQQMLRMKTDFDHVHSAEQGGIDTPSYYKTPSHAQFKDHYLTALLSFKGTWHRGLNKGQFKVLIETLKKQDIEERKLALNIEQTPSLIKFKKWTAAKFPELTLNNFDLSNEELFEKVFAICAKGSSVVEYFLTHVVFSNIGYSAEQFTSSPSHLMGGFKTSVIFSATPLAKIAYPKALKKIKNDDLFEAQVLAQSTKTKNQNFVFPKTINDFFEKISANRTAYAHVRHMIDAGGFLCHEMNHDVAQKWLNSSELDGVIYFKDGTEMYAETLCCKLGDETIEFSRVEELKLILEKRGLKWEDLKIGVFFDAAHAESAHFDPIPMSGAFIFAGDALTLSHAIQSIMRERGFLNEAINQLIIWVVQEDLKTKMQGKCEEFSSSIIHSWCLKNEVKEKKKKIVMAGYQEIIFLIEQYALLTHEDRRQSILKQAKGFREMVNPQAAWGGQKKTEETHKVLLQFAQTLYEKFDFSLPYEQNHVLKGAINQKIQEVHQKISSIVIDFHKNVVSEMHQKCVIKKQMRTIQYKSRPADLFPEPVVKHLKINDGKYLSSISTHAMPVREAFNTPHLTENYYVESNQLTTAKCTGKSLKETFLKTIDFILIITSNEGSYVAEAISNDVLPEYIEDLNRQQIDESIHHQAFIVRADGVLYHKGKGSLEPKETTVATILRSKWMHDVLIDTALLNGKLLYSKRFKERVRDWPNFMGFWKKILSALPLKKEITVKALLSFLPDIEKELILN